MRRRTLLYLIGGLANVAIGARLLAIPLYASHLGASPATVGLLYAVFAATGSIAAIPTGFLVDRHGGRRLLLVAFIAGSLAQLLAVPGWLPLMFVSQALAGLCWSSTQLAAVLVIIAVNPNRARLGRVIGIASLSNQVGLLLGPALAGLLVALLGFRWLLAVASLPPMLAAAIVAVILHEPPARRAVGSFLRSSQELLMRPGMIPIALLTGSVGVVWGGFQAYFAVYAARGAGLSAGAIGWLVAIAALCAALSRIPSGAILDRMGSTLLGVAAGSTVFGVALAVLPHLHSFVPIALLLALTVPFSGFAMMAWSVAAVELGGEEGRGRAVSIGQATYSIASAGAPALVAPVMNASFSTGFLVVCLLAVGTVVTALLLRLRTIRATGRRALRESIATR
jgi:MFS family permease